MDRNRRVSIKVRGIVQGVGFRPRVYNLARKYLLYGWVRNQSDGLELEVAGADNLVESFLRDLQVEAPPLAKVVEMKVLDRPFAPMESFRILESRSLQYRLTLVAPDVGICDDCLRELLDPTDRRYLYPFVNCTNCGPRYSIIRDVPYDREKTTMSRFSMCPDCRQEFDDPTDRRFHAQPNACWSCGPQVWLETGDGKKIAKKNEAISEAIRRLHTGSIVAVKGIGGFHLAVEATQKESVRRLRELKNREDKPFAVMFPDLETIRLYCHLSEEEESLLQSPQRPIVLLNPYEKPGPFPLASSVAPRQHLIGAFLPYTPLHHLLFLNDSRRPLVMTSGNKSDEPIVKKNKDARNRLSQIADFFLLHDRQIHVSCDDSVLRVLSSRPCIIRRARGYAPMPIFLNESVPSLLALGAELKNTICLTRGREAFLSQHTGDLGNLETLEAFEENLTHLQRILEVRPELIVHDLHPDFSSTQWAMKQKGLPCLAVQHHHAHIAAVVAERKLSGPVIGLALDGTGYGSDGTLWGGEVLIVNEEKFEQWGHFRRFSLPGGEKAVKEPWRTALSLLWDLKSDCLELEYEDFLKYWSGKGCKVLLRMLERRFNSPITSSCGRLFDAVASLLGLCHKVTYEGQAAIELEQLLRLDKGYYEGAFFHEGGKVVLDHHPIILGVIKDIRRGVSPGIVSARFHNSLAILLAEMAATLHDETGLNRVVLSGGVFQNAYLSESVERELSTRGLEVYSHVDVPCNDGGIALGQAIIGAWYLKRREEKIGAI